MSSPIDVLRTYVELGLVTPSDRVTFQASRAGLVSLAGGARWHARPTYDCQETSLHPETLTVAEALTILTSSTQHIAARGRDRYSDDPVIKASANNPNARDDVRVLCPCGVQRRWAPVSEADHDTIVWLADARSFLASPHARNRVEDLLELLWPWTAGAPEPRPASATLPNLAEAAASARSELAARLPSRVATPAKEHLLTSLLGSWTYRTGASAAHPGYVALAATMRGLGGGLDQVADAWSGRERIQRPDQVPYAVRVWKALTGVQAWRVPANGEAVHLIEIEDYDLATGVARGPLLCDMRTPHLAELFCLDRGYSAAEVAAAWRAFGNQAVTFSREAQIEDFIAAWRVAQL